MNRPRTEPEGRQWQSRGPTLLFPPHVWAASCVGWWTCIQHRARESAQAEKRALAEHIIEWARRAGDRLDGLSDKGRREVLELLLDGATIDRQTTST